MLHRWRRGYCGSKRHADPDKIEGGIFILHRQRRAAVDQGAIIHRPSNSRQRLQYEKQVGIGRSAMFHHDLADLQHDEVRIERKNIILFGIDVVADLDAKAFEFRQASVDDADHFAAAGISDQKIDLAAGHLPSPRHRRILPTGKAVIHV